MKVSELRVLLAEQEAMGNGDKEVHFSYNYGDHWKTTVAPVVDTVKLGKVAMSYYHQMDKVIYPCDEEDDDTPAPDTREVVVLS